MRRRRHRHRPAVVDHCAFEPLERRRLLAQGLILNGTAGPDNIVVDIVGQSYHVTINGDLQQIPLADVSSIVIECFASSDLVDLRAAQHEVHIYGGFAGDQIHLGLGSGNLSRITAPVICDGGPGSNDLVSLWDTVGPAPVDPPYYDYTVANDTVDRAGAPAGGSTFGGVRYENIEYVDITGSTRHDTFYVTSLLEGVHLRAFGLDGDDTMYVGSTGDGGMGDLDNIRGSVFFNGQYDGNDTVVIDDAFSDNPADAYTIAGEFVTRPGTAFGGLEYWAERVILSASAADNQIRVDSIPEESAVTVRGNGGNDSLVAGANAVPGLGDLDDLRGPLTFLGGDGNDSATLDDGGSPLGRSFILDSDSLVVQEGFGAQFRGLFYSATESIVLHGSAANGNAYNVPSFGAGNTFTAHGGAGSESFAVGNGTIDAVLGALVFNGGPGESVDFLTIQDFEDPDGDDYAVSASAVARTNFGGVTYAGFESLELNAGAGDSVIHVNGAAAGTYLTLNAGGGDDHIHVGDQSHNLDGVPGVHNYTGGAGFDTLSLDDSANAQDTFWDFLAGNVTRDRADSDVDSVALYDTFESLSVVAGSGVDTAQVFETAAGAPLAFAPGQSEWDNVLVYYTEPDAPVSVLPGILNGPYVAVNVGGDGPATVLFPQSMRLNGLHVSDAGTAKLPAGGDKYLHVKNVLGIGAAGKLDLADNDLMFDYAAGDPSPLGSSDGTTYSGITGMIQAGHNGGAWNGAGGIVTSIPAAATGLTTLGVAEAGEALGLTGAQTGTFNGLTVDATAVIVKYTYRGDANLDGFISADDYTAIDFAISAANAFAYGNGDFNFDGFLSADDYTALDFNLASQGEPL